MENLNLNAYGVVEMDAVEMEKVNGGSAAALAIFFLVLVVLMSLDDILHRE